MPHTIVEERRARLLGKLDRAAERVGSDATPLAADRIEFLVREAEELYWNELSWEELTDEERVAGGHLTELVFPGFLSFIDALLHQSLEGESYQEPSPHPEVVELIMVFLADRFNRATVELGRGADSEKLVWARAMTSHLIDLVLYRLYGLTGQEREDVETGA